MVPEEDFDEILKYAGDDILAFKNKRILITGGTGFIGQWLTGSIERANKKLGANIELRLLGRDPMFIPACDAVIHAAPVLPQPIIQQASVWGKVPLLYLSSGVVYDERPNYAQYRADKVQGEQACRAYGNARIARLFAFIGPGVQVDRGYAAGDFIADAKAGGPIHVRGNPWSIRTWMYPTDMVAWLWAIFARGRVGEAYDVGAYETSTIMDLAWGIAREAGCGVLVHYNTQPETRYAPSLLQNDGGLDLRSYITLNAAVKRSLACA